MRKLLEEMEKDIAEKGDVIEEALQGAIAMDCESGVDGCSTMGNAAVLVRGFSCF